MKSSNFKKELKNYQKSTHISDLRENNKIKTMWYGLRLVRPWVPGFSLILPLNYSIQGLALQKGNSNWVKKELNRVKNKRTTMQEDDDDFGVTNEDTELLKLSLFTERKEDDISTAE